MAPRPLWLGHREATSALPRALQCPASMSGFQGACHCCRVSSVPGPAAGSSRPLLRGRAAQGCAATVTGSRSRSRSRRPRSPVCLPLGALLPPQLSRHSSLAVPRGGESGALSCPQSRAGLRDCPLGDVPTVRTSVPVAARGLIFPEAPVPCPRPTGAPVCSSGCGILLLVPPPRVLTGTRLVQKSPFLWLVPA